MSNDVNDEVARLTRLYELVDKIEERVGRLAFKFDELDEKVDLLLIEDPDHPLYDDDDFDDLEDDPEGP